MRILRPLLLGGITVLSTMVVCFVAADRVVHSSFPAPHTMTIAKAEPQDAEPEATGTITQGAEIVEQRQPRGLDGFDTERLNALMRGEVLPAPAKSKPKPVASTSTSASKR